MAKATRLNQVVATVAGKKAQAEKSLTEAYHIAQKPDLFSGLARTYTPKEDKGEGKPPERKMPQFRVPDLYRKVENDLVEMFDAVGTQDWSNCKARADVVVDGKVVVPQAPVTFLLFLEKQLTNLRNFVEKLPVRDGGEDWSYQQEAALYVTPNVQTQVTAKVQEALVLYPATEQHPAQCQMISKDVVAGYWENRKFSGAISKQDQDKLVERVKKFSEAVKTAREEANHVEADSVRVGGSILDYIFSGVIK
jgi:hypothetical protein